MNQNISKYQLISNNPVDLEQFINELYPEIQECQIILLQGDLGAGKTTFVRYLAKKIGIKQNVTSPSFSYMKTYDGLVHIDLYNYKGDIEEFEDYFEDNIVAIEWANLRKLNFQKYILINASIDKDNHIFEVSVVK
ncbi:tRNA (adenosine(37)-N6)-threonylcarbamoyltransferase complex ATPase subunit type 1 TsaE [Mycoplasmopsis columboralis]|uniref:tRNA threonylcarbamoyladenosine biosynthesis protein TsaE n=1 Tax=Mycoplasmopsis columboralis TaxID=171282 RepID=A0A449B744_9BACT|nr:tRNA (adenosine(37)-N6)-threonylcarbamoyltransferase complex ATPase subunit type 1 TsaE [Mycoplasmopsis columboralis]VEU76404.1 ATP/GTP-binding protein [Mycoplasmopsis columboralis]